MRLLAILVFLAVGLIRCGSSATKDGSDKTFDLSDVKDHIHLMNKSYGERFRHEDMDFYKERYCHDIIIMPEQLPQISGIDSVRIFNYNEGRNKELSIVVTATKIYGGPEVVIEEGHYSFPDEKESNVDQGKFIALWKKEEGKWKLFREIWNSDAAR